MVKETSLASTVVHPARRAACHNPLESEIVQHLTHVFQLKSDGGVGHLRMLSPSRCQQIGWPFQCQRGEGKAIRFNGLKIQ